MTKKTMILLTLTLCFTLVSHAQQLGETKKFDLSKSYEDKFDSSITVKPFSERNLLLNNKSAKKFPRPVLDCKAQRAAERENNCGVQILPKFNESTISGSLNVLGYSHSMLSCFNEARPESCHKTDIKMVCSCLRTGGVARYGGGKFSSDDKNIDFNSIPAAGIQSAINEVTLLPAVQQESVENDIKKTLDCSNFKKDDQREDCQRKKIAMLKADEDIQKKTIGYISESEKQKKDFEEKAKLFEQYNHCLPFSEYMEKTKKIPPQKAVDAFDFGSKIRDSEKSRNYHDALLSVMKGGNPNDAIIKYKLFSIPEFSFDEAKQLRVLYSYMVVNPQWRYLIESKEKPRDQLKVVESFRGVFVKPGLSSKERYDEFTKFTSSEEWINANNQANNLNEDFSHLYKAVPDKVNSDYELVNRIYSAKSSMIAPIHCEDFSKSLEGEKILMPEFSLSSERFTGCLKTYNEICSNLSSSIEDWSVCEKLKSSESSSDDKVKRCLELKNTDKQQELLNSAKEIVSSSDDIFYEKMKDYGEDAKTICENENKIDREKVTREGFRQNLCDREKKYRNVTNASIEKICTSGDENELTNVYANQISSGGNISIALKMKEAVDSDPQAGAVNKIITTMAGEYSGKTAEQDGDDFFDSISKYANKINGKSTSFGASNSAANTNQSTSTFADEIFSGLKDASQTLSSPKIDNNVQSFINGHIPASNILPADLANSASEGQLSAAKTSVDNGVDVLEKRLAAFERQELKSTKDSAAQVEIENLRKQIEELKSQSEQLKAQLDKEKESASKTAESKANPEAASNEGPNRSPASVDLKTSIPSVAGQTQSVAQSGIQPSKIFNDMYSDNSFHGIPTIGSSKSIDAKALSARSSNDALLSIYTDKNISSLVDAVAAGPSNNILVVGNALEMQESTVKEKKFQTKEIVVDQKRLEMVRSNPDILRSLIEESKIKNHEGILTLKNGENQLNYIMRKDDAGKIVILPLNIARRVTLKNLQDELKN